VLFAFIDENGHPHPNDSATRPVLAAVCLEVEYLRRLNTDIYRLKRNLLGKDQFELEAKANKLINRGTFRRRPEKWEFVESFFEMCRNFPMTIFSVVMERPNSSPSTDRNFLPMPFRYILYRINKLTELESPGELAAVMFDGDGSQYNRISERFSNWLFRSDGGRSCVHLADNPFFVDSRLTPGIQVADMVAGVIRIYQENELNRHIPQGDPFLSAIARYYRIIEQKTRDLPSPSGSPEPWYGIYFMSERMHHVNDRMELESEEDQPNQNQAH